MRGRTDLARHRLVPMAATGTGSTTQGFEFPAAASAVRVGAALGLLLADDLRRRAAARPGGCRRRCVPRENAAMSDVLLICRDLPEMRVAKGWTLIEEGVRVDRLFVVKTGAFDVVRQDVRITRVAEPGAFLGEISAVLGSTATADVVAAEDSVVHVIDRASSAVRSQPELTFAIAQLLARRLAAVTAYLVDIKHQYADSGTHLALMDEVLGNLVAMQPARVKPGSERPDLPDY
jgi:hypothetical protein